MIDIAYWNVPLSGERLTEVNSRAMKEAIERNKNVAIHFHPYGDTCLIQGTNRCIEYRPEQTSSRG